MDNHTHPTNQKEERLRQKRIDYATQKWGHKVYARFHQEELKTKDRTLIEQIAELDPTTNKQYLPWLCQRYFDSSFKLNSDRKDEIKELLQWFHYTKAYLPFSDINQYENIYELKYWYKKVGHVISKRQAEHKIRQFLYRKGLVEYIVDHPEGKVLALNGFEAVQHYARGSRWCITERSIFEQYNDSQNLYLLVWRKTKFLMSISRTNPAFIELADSADQKIIEVDFCAYKQPWPRFLVEIILLLHLTDHGWIKRWWKEQLDLELSPAWVKSYWGDLILKNMEHKKLLNKISGDLPSKHPCLVSHTLCRCAVTTSFLDKFPELEIYLKKG